jgi:2-dehydropantoate 2-reductase
MKPFLPPGCTVLCLQNGVDNAERLSRVLEFDAVPAAVYVALDMVGPGHVVHHGRGELIIGPSPGSERAAQAFIAAHIPIGVTSKVMDALWAKLTVNCAYNALSTLTQLPYGELISRPGMQATLLSVVEECRAVAAALGFTLPAAIGEDVREIARSMPDQRSSTAQDVARGRRSEIDFINGYVVRRGDAAGIPVPLNRLLYSLVRIKDDAVP